MGKRWMQWAALVASLGLVTVLSGCSQADAVKAASMIHAYVPTVMALAEDAAAMAGAMDPADAAAMQAVSAKVRAELQTLGQVSGAYAAAPSSDGWASVGSAVDTLVADSDQGLLAAVAIKNPESQLRAKAALSALDAAVHVLDGYLLSARTPAQAQAAAAERTVKVQSVVKYWRPQDWRRVEEAFAMPGEELAAWEARRGF